MFEILIFLIKLISSYSQICSIQSCNELHYCFIVNFKTFSSLKFNCSSQYTSINRILFKPLNPLILNDDLNMENLLLTKDVNNSVRIEFSNIQGFELSSNPFQALTSISSQFVIYQFINSQFKFYSNLSPVSFTESNLQPSIFKHNIKYILFLTEITYEKQTPNTAFDNCYFTQIVFNYLQDSFISNNYPTFNNVKSDLNSNIQRLSMSVYNFKLDSPILDKSIFRKLQVLFIENYLREIQSDLFKGFDEIRYIGIRINNLKSFLYKGLKWINYINQNISINISRESLDNANSHRVVYIEFTSKLKYNLPDEDFCLFDQLPFKQLVFLIIWNKKLTCTFTWIMQYIEICPLPKSSYALISYARTIKEYKNILSEDYFKVWIRDCKFDERLAKCKLLTRIQNSSELDSYYYEENLFSSKILKQFINYILSIILFPLVCVSGIICNILVILTIYNPNFRKDFNLKLYKSMVLSSIFNMSTCLINLFTLFTKCVQPAGIYCPTIRKQLTTQYAFVLFHFIGSMLKLCSNFFNISICFNRFMMISDLKNIPILLKIYNLDIKYEFVFFVILSLLLNVYKLFQYKINDSRLYYGIMSDFVSKNYIQYPFPNFDFSSMQHFYIYFNLIFYFTDNILCTLLSFIIDVHLIRFLRKSKAKTSDFNKKKSKREALEFRLTTMILINCLMLLVTHCFEFLFSLVTIISVIYKRDLLANTIFACDDVNSFHCVFRQDFATFFYFIYFSFPFFSLWIFNRKFVQSLTSLLRFKNIKAISISK